MGIRRIQVENFKSYRNLDVTLGRLNVLIGANASGKSNFVEIFRFLHDIATYGLNNAISLQGGAQYLLNVHSERERRLSVAITADAIDGFTFERQKSKENEDDFRYDMRVRELTYSFALDFSQGDQPEIYEDRLELTCDFARRAEDSTGEAEAAHPLGSGVISLTTKNGQPVHTFDMPLTMPFMEWNVLPHSIFKTLSKDDVRDASPSTLLLESHFFYIPVFFRPSRVFIGSDIALHTFNSQLARKPTEVAGKVGLEEDGSNLALVLRNIFADDETKRRFIRLYRDLLPFVVDMDVEQLDRSLLIKLEETYAPHRMFPATFISDGTIDSAALVVALYFQDRSVIIIEEPEGNLHPYLIAKLVAMLEDVSEQKQIIVTTHNPELVKHAARNYILLVSRGKDGNSTITRPAENEHLQAFLGNDLGIEDLYVKNLLEA